MMIYDVFQQGLQRPQRKPTKDLYVSDLGMHPYKAMSRILRGEQSAFDTKTMERMQCGVAFEEDTLKVLAANLPIMAQFPLWNALWSGYADMVIGHGTNQVTIIEGDYPLTVSK